MSASEIVTVGLSESGNRRLDFLKENGYFAEKIDGYRFAVSLALASGAINPEISKRSTFLNVGSFDPDQAFKRAVEALLPEILNETTVYRAIERLADWGVNELYEQAKKGDIDFLALLSSPLTSGAS